MIERILHQGKFIDDTTILGERRADGVAPAHGNGVQLSATRFLVLNSTLRFRGSDDNCSITWQLRRDHYTGPIIREGLFAKAIDDWYPLGPKYRCVRQFGHPVAFGVPKGALINGRPAPHGNVFTIKWRTVGRVFVPEGGYIMWKTEPPEVRAGTQDVQWAQFKLSDDENDLVMLQEARSLRQVGYETGAEICALGSMRMNQSYVQAVPFNADATEWVDVNQFGLVEESASRAEADPAHAGGFIAALRYRFNPATRLYQWVQVGPRIGPGLMEGNISPHGSDWVISARREKDPGVAWCRVHDPFSETPTIEVPGDVKTFRAPLTVFKCPDGITRLCTGDRTLSPYQSSRDPIFIWDIDVDSGFVATARHHLYSPRGDGTTIPVEHQPLADIIKILPHTGGRQQTVIHRVRTCAMAVKQADYPSRIHPLTEGDFWGTAIFHATIHYDQDYPARWTFAPAPALAHHDERASSAKV